MTHEQNSYQLAIREDIADNHGVAIIKYLEAILLDKDVTDAAYVDLGVLLFILGTSGPPMGPLISQPIRDFSCAAFSAVLACGTYAFPQSLLVRYWRDYFNEINDGVPFPLSFWESYALSLSDDALLGDELLSIRHSENEQVHRVVRRSYRSLLDRCRDTPTKRNLYLLSILPPQLPEDY